MKRAPFKKPTTQELAAQVEKTEAAYQTAQDRASAARVALDVAHTHYHEATAIVANIKALLGAAQGEYAEAVARDAALPQRS